MSKTLEEWIEIYNRKAKTEFKPDEKFTLVYRPDKGFCELSCDYTKVLVGAVSGDGKFWKKIAEKFARRMGLTECGTTCVRREIRAYIRLFGHKIISVDENKNLHGILTQDKDGNFAFLAETVFENGEHGYKILWQVPKAGERE